MQPEQGGACSFTNSAAVDLLAAPRNKPTDDLRTEGLHRHRKRIGIDLDDETSHNDRIGDLGIKAPRPFPRPRHDWMWHSDIPRTRVNHVTPIADCIHGSSSSSARVDLRQRKSPSARVTCSAFASPRLHWNCSREPYCPTSICLTPPTPR